MKSYDELKALIEQRGVHPEFGDAGEGFAIEQNPHELATFLVRMQELGVASVLEIGTGYKGGLSRFLAQDMGWQVTSLDIVIYDHKFPGVVYYNLDNAPDTLPKHDLVFIDGNHAYETAKADYELWGEFARKVIAFHDILGFRDCKGVEKFWHQLLMTEFGKAADVATGPDVKAASGIGWIEL